VVRYLPSPPDIHNEAVTLTDDGEGTTSLSSDSGYSKSKLLEGGPSAKRRMPSY